MAVVSRIKPEKIANRIDASFYHPSFINNEEQLMGSGVQVCKLKDLIFDGRRAVYFQTNTLEKEEAPDTWVPFLTADDLGEDGFFIDLNSRRRVSPEFAANYSNGKLRESEILVKVKGPNQTTAYNKYKPKRDVLVSGTIWGALVKQELIDPDYLVAILSCPYANIARSRLRTNTNVEFLSPTDLCELDLPLLQRGAQKFIGNIVKKAEQLKNLSLKIIDNVDRELNKIIPDDSNPVEICNRVKVRMLCDRLDPRPYRTHFLTLIEALSGLDKADRIGNMADVSPGDPVPSSEFVSNGQIPLIRIRNIYQHQFVGVDTFVSKKYAKTKKVSNAKLKRIVLGMDGIFRAQFFVEEELPMHINQRIAIIDAFSIRPELLTHWLNRKEGQMQLNQWAVKTTVDHTNLVDISNIIIPRLNKEKENEIADLLLISRYGVFYSKRLIATSTHFIQDIIEGKIQEKELIQAQQALEKGDTSLDRQLLKRMKTDGIDGEGDPLFPDIDQLYELLDEAGCQ